MRPLPKGKPMSNISETFEQKYSRIRTAVYKDYVKKNAIQLTSLVVGVAAAVVAGELIARKIEND